MNLSPNDFDPATIGTPGGPVEEPFYGWGSSNQINRTRLPALNLGPGMDAHNQAVENYIQDTTGDIKIIQDEIDVIDDQILVIQGDITTINNEITVIQGDITVLQGLVPLKMAIIGTVSDPRGGTVAAATNTLTLTPADLGNGGVVSDQAQGFNGEKYFLKRAEFDSGLQSNVDVALPRTTNGGQGELTLGSMKLHNYSSSLTESNLFLGYDCGNITNDAIQNIGIGEECLGKISSGGANTCIGNLCGDNITSGSNNVCIGNQSGFGLGNGASGNIMLGAGSGALVTNTNDNICIGNAGVIMDSDTIRIGDTHTDCYIQGIGGVAPGGTPQTVIIDPVTGKLGSSAGSLSLGNIGAAPNAQGATLTGTVLNLEPASLSFGGVVTDSTQTLNGEKTFQTGVKLVSAGAITPSLLNFYEADVGLVTGLQGDLGVISAMTVRGVATNAALYEIRMSRIGNMVNLILPAFKITNWAGATYVEFITPISGRFRPTHKISILNSNWLQATSGVRLAEIHINTDGRVEMFRESGTDWTLNFGPSEDISLTYAIVT